MKAAIIPLFAAIIFSGCASQISVIPPASSPTASPQPQTINGSILNLLDGADKECTWTGTIEGYEIEGVVYTSEQKFRAEATTQMSLIPITGYAVGDGNTITAWASLGFTDKVTFSYTDIQKVLNQSSNNPIVKELATDHTFTCVPWIPDPTAFNTPST